MEGTTVSAVEQLRQHTFQVRDKSRGRPSVDVGTLIKVGIRGERFWCRVRRVRQDGSLVCVVDNDLIKSPWKCGDEIVVQKTHVLETSDPMDMTFASLLSLLGSPAEAALLWRELRLMGGFGVPAKPKTFFVLPDIN
jgi:hypothetical protein